MGKSKEVNHSDLIAAPNTIKSCLQTRHASHQLYTRLGSNHLVVVNPHKPVTYNDDQSSLDYVARYKDINTTHFSLDHQQPHLYELVNHTYYNLRRTGDDQLIVLK
jgi:chitin synthase